MTIGVLFGAVVSFAFSMDNALVPQNEILSGGPPKDGIPAILQPRFVAAHQADFLKADDSVIGVVVDGVAKAYPLNILTWHEVVNDWVDDTPIVVTF
jgi:hypothetical protein